MIVFVFSWQSGAWPGETVRRIIQREVFWQGRMAPWYIYVEQQNVGMALIEPDLAVGLQ